MTRGRKRKGEEEEGRQVRRGTRRKNWAREREEVSEGRRKKRKTRKRNGEGEEEVRGGLREEGIGRGTKRRKR